VSSTPEEIKQPVPTEIRLSLLDLALVVAENWRALVFVPLAAGLIALGISFLIRPTFTAVTRILPPAQQQSASAALAAQLGALAGLVSAGTGIKNPADQYVALLKSRTIYDAIVHRFNLRELYDVRYLDDARKGLQNRTKIYSGSKDGIITIEVDEHRPELAADIANAFVGELHNLTKTLAISEAAQRRLFFEMQLGKAKDALTRSEQALRASGVSESALRALPQSVLESLARLKAEITAREIKLASMRTYMTDSNPEIQLAIREVIALRSELSKLEQSSTTKLVASDADYIARYRDFKYHETLFELMAKQFELARLDEAREGAIVQVVDVAVPPERKSKPRKSLIAVLTTLGMSLLMLSIVLARQILRDYAANPAAATKLERIRDALLMHKR
jgi:tyrosine-protein kinase Etk/Wzc